MVALAVVSRLNRKIMLVASILTMGICHIVLGICFHVQENELRPQAESNSLGGQAASEGQEGVTMIPDVLATTSTVSPFSTTLPNGEYDHRPGILGWLPIVTVVIFLFMGNIGYGTLIWVVTAELLPPKVRSIANSIIICFAFLCGFLIAKTFVDLLEGLGQSGTFFLYGNFDIFL